jgi:hypothetical protein
MQFLVDVTLTQSMEGAAQILQQLLDVSIGTLHGGQSVALSLARDSAHARTSSYYFGNISRPPVNLCKTAPPDVVQRQQLLTCGRVHRPSGLPIGEQMEFSELGVMRVVGDKNLLAKRSNCRHRTGHHKQAAAR